MDQLSILCIIITIILKELKSLRDFERVWAPWESTSLDIIFKITLIFRGKTGHIDPYTLIVMHWWKMHTIQHFI